MAADLATHGILPRKTFSTKPALVDPNLVQHYWRGVIDGDGNFSKDGYDLKLCGDYEVVFAFQVFTLSLCPEVRAKVYKDENIFAFAVSKKTTICLIKTLYDNATVFLDRKFARAQQILRRDTSFGPVEEA